jgi:hypothetical protein
MFGMDLVLIFKCAITQFVMKIFVIKIFVIKIFVIFGRTGRHLVGDLLRRNFSSESDLHDRIFAVESRHQLIVAGDALAPNLKKSVKSFFAKTG